MGKIIQIEIPNDVPEETSRKLIGMSREIIRKIVLDALEEGIANR